MAYRIAYCKGTLSGEYDPDDDNNSLMNDEE